MSDQSIEDKIWKEARRKVKMEDEDLEDKVFSLICHVNGSGSVIEELHSRLEDTREDRVSHLANRIKSDIVGRSMDSLGGR